MIAKNPPPRKIPEELTKTPETKRFFEDLTRSVYYKWAETREGTFTPVIWDASKNDSEGQTYSNQEGFYRRIGSIVFFNGNVTLSSLGTLTGAETALIGGLPFPASNDEPLFCGFSVIAANYSITAGTTVGGYVPPGESYVNMSLWASTSGVTNLTLTQMTASGNTGFAGWYIAQEQ